jgi:hypothetical protein
VVIASAPATFLVVSLSQDAAQSSAHVGVDAIKDIRFAMLEVPKPSSQGTAQILTDRSHASTVRTPVASHVICGIFLKLIATGFLTLFTARS